MKSADLSTFEHQNLVSIDHSGEAMSNEYGGLPLDHFMHRIHNILEE
jgi:hypothetical protein